MDIADYEGAVDLVVRAARERRAAAISALAVHGLMTGVFDEEHKYRLNHFDLLVPDGQPVRWVLNWLHRAGLRDRVYGPNLTLNVCARAASEGLPVYFYGSTGEVLASLRQKLEAKHPGLIIAGMKPSRFRRLRPEEKVELATHIRSSGATIAFIGLGCPRQEAFAYEFRDHLQMPILAVGAAFPFLAEISPQAPRWMQNAGLEWLFRLRSEPRRLWRRYLLLNPAYLLLVAMQALEVSRFSTDGRLPTHELLYGLITKAGDPQRILVSKKQVFVSMLKAFSNSTLARNTACMTLGQGVQLNIQALYFVEIARSLGVRNYGAFVGVVALVGIIHPFGALGSGKRTFSSALVTTAFCGSLLLLAVRRFHTSRCLLKYHICS